MGGGGGRKHFYCYSSNTIASIVCSLTAHTMQNHTDTFYIRALPKNTRGRGTLRFSDPPPTKDYLFHKVPTYNDLNF